MKSASKKSTSWMLLLVALGVVALFVGPKSLMVLIPAAALIWYEAAPMLRRERH